MEGDVSQPFGEASIRELLDSTAALSLATLGTDGELHLAPVYFAADERLGLYFFSNPESQHGKDLRHNPRAAAAIYPECKGWQDIRGLQLRGEVHPVAPGPEWEIGWKRYFAKFPFVAELKKVVAQNWLYVFAPRWFRLVDNRQGFGFKREWTLP